jgi:hypothetical protein
MKKILALLAISFLSAYASVFALPPSVKALAAVDAIDTIRSRYTQINKNLSRYRKVKKELSGYSAEGGALEAYFDGDSIRKIVANHYGESGRAVEEFYYWDERLIFVFRKDFRYDKPLSGRTVSSQENRFYFDNNRLIRWIGENGKQIPSTQAEYSEKQREYLENSEEFLKLARS